MASVQKTKQNNNQKKKTKQNKTKQKQKQIHKEIQGSLFKTKAWKLNLLWGGGHHAKAQCMPINAATGE